MLKQLAGGGQSRFGHVAGRRDPGLAGKHAGEVTRAHRRFLGQVLHAQIGGEVLQDPALHFAYRPCGARLLQAVAAELQLSAGTSQVHHHILRHVAGEGKSVVVFHQRQGQIEPGTDAAGGPDGAVLHVRRAAFGPD